MTLSGSATFVWDAAKSKRSSAAVFRYGIPSNQRETLQAFTFGVGIGGLDPWIQGDELLKGCRVIDRELGHDLGLYFAAEGVGFGADAELWGGAEVELPQGVFGAFNGFLLELETL